MTCPRLIPSDGHRETPRHGHDRVFVDVKDLEPRSVRVDVGEVKRVSVPQTGVAKGPTVVVEAHRAINNLVLAVGVANAQVMIALSYVRAVFGPASRVKTSDH
jgi:hypothetical protein